MKREIVFVASQKELRHVAESLHVSKFKSIRSLSTFAIPIEFSVKEAKNVNVRQSITLETGSEFAGYTNKT